MVDILYLIIGSYTYRSHNKCKGILDFGLDVTKITSLTGGDCVEYTLIHE